MYNPYGNQRQSQGPYGANLNPDRDPRMGASNMGLPFNPGASASASPMSSLPMFSQQMSYRPEPGQAPAEADWDRTMDRPRDDTQHLNTPLSQPSSQMPPQRDDLYCPFTATSSYSAPSSTAGPPPTASNSSGSSGIDGSLSWLRDITRSTSAKPQTSTFPSSSSSFLGGSGDSSLNFLGGGDSQIKHSAGVIPGLGDYPDMEPPSPQQNNPPPQQNNPPPQQNNPPTTMYGAETATNILRHFNLEKEDLEQLLAIPEEEITPDNLPQILRQIRIEKNRKRAAASAYKDPSPARPGFDNSSRADSKQTKVMDYGHKDLTSSAMNISKDMPLSKQSSTIADYAKDIPPIPTKAEVKIETSPVQPSKVIEYGHTGKRVAGAGTESGTMGAIARAIEGIMKFSSPSTSTATATTPTKPIPSLGSASQDQISPATSFPSRFPSTFPSATSKSSEKPSTTQSLSSLPKQDIDYGQASSKHESKQAAKKSGLIIIDSVKKPISKKPQSPPAHRSNPGPPPFISHRKSRFHESYGQTAALTLPANPIQTVSSNVITGIPNVFPAPFVPVTSPPSVLNHPSPAQIEALTAKHSPTWVNIQDYIAACPISFPHTCSLCQGESAFTNMCPKECLSMKDWISHQNSSLHIENCKSLRVRYPDWDGKALPVASVTPSSTSSLSPPIHIAPEPRDKSRSQSPRRDKKKERKRSRSASPPSSSSSSRRPRSRSRSHERPESPPRRAEERRRDDKRTSPKRKDKSRLVSPPSCSRRPRSRSRSRERRRRSSPKRKDERRASPRSEEGRRFSPLRSNNWRMSRSSPRRSRERRYSPTRYSPLRYSPHSRSPSRSSPTPPRGHDRRERRRSLSRSRERRSPSDKRSADKSTDRRRKHSELEQATKEVLEKSSVLTALSGSADVESLVETMVPLLMSRLAKEMAASSVPSTAAKKKKVVKKTISKPTAVKSSTMVRLGSIVPPLSHDDVAAFAKQFGKTKSILLFRQKCQAVVCFEKEEDAKKLRNSPVLLIKEHPVTIVKLKAAVSTAQKKSAVSGVKRTLKSAAKITPATSETSASEKTSGEASTSKATTSKAAAAETAPENIASPEPKVEEPLTPEPAKGEPVPSQSPSPSPWVETVGETLENRLDVKSIKDKVVFDLKLGRKCQASGDSAVEGPSSLDFPSEEILEEGGIKIPETTEVEPESGSKPSLEPASLETLDEPLEAEEGEPSKSGHEGADESVSSSQEKEDKPGESSGFVELSNEEDEKEGKDSKEEEAAAVRGWSAYPCSLTEGETLDKRLTFDTFKCHVVTLEKIFEPNFCKTSRRLVLLCDLPDYDPQDPYTKAELAEKLSPFGFLNDANDIYVVPQSNMAFVFMPDSQAIVNLVRAFEEEPVPLAVFRGRRLKPHVLKGCLKEPWSFYCWLMRVACHIKRDNVDRGRTVFISNISSDLAEFRKKLEKFGFITNYVPLLNQAFVEYESNAGGDRLGVYHSLLDKPPSYTLTRMISPRPKHDPQPPSVFAAIPDAADRAPGVTVPQRSSRIPHFSRGEYYITMSCGSFLFPTESPWFHIPDFETVPMKKCFMESFPAVDKTAVMLTNLQCTGFTHESQTHLVWPWLKGTNLQCFYYDFIVLPLQNRAFVNFYSAEKCAQFAESFFTNAHIKKPAFQPHYIHDKLFSVSTEEEAYTSLMALSNSRAPEKHQLEHRLLCVFLGRFTAKLVRLVMEVVASAAPVLGFLPLANRVCIELPKVSDVAKVRLKFCNYQPEDKTQEELWRRVLTLETAAEVKRRVKRAGSDAVCLVSPFDGPSCKCKDMSHYHLFLGRKEQDWQQDWDKASSSSARFRLSSPRESTKHCSSGSSPSSRDGHRSRSRSSSPRRPSESSISKYRISKYHWSCSQSSSSRDKLSEKPKDQPKESDLAKSGLMGSDKGSSKTQEKNAESKESSTCVEPTAENIEDVQDDTRIHEQLGPEGSNFDQPEEQKDSSDATEDSSDATDEHISENYQVLDSFVEAMKSGEGGVHFVEAVQVLDNEANEEPTDERLSEEAPNKEDEKQHEQARTMEIVEEDEPIPQDQSQDEQMPSVGETETVLVEGLREDASTEDKLSSVCLVMDASQSENVENLKPDAGSKRKREDDVAETQEVCSKTAKTDGQEGSEHENFDIVASAEDQTITEEAEKGEDVPNDETLLEKFKVIDDEMESKKKEATSARSTRSGRSTQGDEKEKLEARNKQESTVPRIEEEMVELKAEDLVREEPTKDESLTRRRSTRGKKDSIEDGLSKQDVSPRSTRERKLIKTATSSDEAENKTSEDFKGSATDSEKGVFEILDSVEEGTKSITEKGKTSTSDLSEKDSTPSQIGETPAKETKTGSHKEKDLVEKVQARSSRQTRSSQRDQPSDSPLRGNTPTRHGRTPARETKSERPDMKDLPKVDVQEELKQEIKIQDAVEVSPKTRRGRLGKQPQTPSKSEGMKEDGNIQEEKAKMTEIIVDDVPRTVEEKEDEPVPEDQSQDEQMPSVGETSETLLVKTDKGLQESSEEEKAMKEEIEQKIQDAVEEEPTVTPKARRGRQRKEPQTPAKSGGRKDEVHESENEKQDEQAKTMEIVEEDEPVHRDRSQDEQMQSVGETSETLLVKGLQEDASTEDKLSSEEEKAIKDLSKVDVQEEIEQEIKIQDAVEEEPTVTPKARRGRPRKQTPAKSEGRKDEVHESENEKQDEQAKTMEIVEEDKPIHRDPSQDEQMPSVGETTETVLVKGLQEDASTEDKLSSEEEKAMGEGKEKAAIVEQESSESIKEATIDDQKQSGRLSDRASKETEDASEVAILEVEKTETQTTRTTRTTRSGKVVLSEGISPKQRVNKRSEPKQESKSESPVKKDVKGLSKTESVQDETEGKEQERSPAKRRGRPRKQPRKSPSKSGCVEAVGQERRESNTEDKMEASAKQEVDKSEIVVDLTEDQPSEDTECASELSARQDSVEKEDAESEERSEEKDDEFVGKDGIQVNVSVDVQHSEQERTGKDEGEAEKVDLEMVSDGEKFPDNTDEEQENQLTQQKTWRTPGEAAEETPETSKSAKQKLEEETEDLPGFVMVDGVGEVEEVETLKSPDRGRKSAGKTPVGSKRRTEADGPESKRSRSQSPPVPSDIKLPPFKPNNPLGQEYVVPKLGFFCDLCSVFYLSESTAREQHCSSRRHYDNLKKHLERKSQGAS